MINISIWQEPWSSGYGWRLMFERLWVRILAPYTGWTFFTLICCKNCINICLKRPKINEKEVGVGPFKDTSQSVHKYHSFFWLNSKFQSHPQLQESWYRNSGKCFFCVSETTIWVISRSQCLKQSSTVNVSSLTFIALFKLISFGPMGTQTWTIYGELHLN